MKTRYALIFLLVLSAGILNAQTNSLFKVKPYQQNPSTDGITIMWQTDTLCYSWIEYGTDTTNLQTARTLIDGLVVSNNTENKIRINGLTPNTRYYYRVCSRVITRFEPYKKEFGRNEKSDFYTFRTLGNNTSDFTCVIFNDIHNNLSLFDKLAEQIKDVNYNFALFNGDCFTDLKSPDNAIKILQHYNEKIDAANKPAYYIRGNHEVRGAFALDMPEIFDRATYFAFSYGDTRFVMLDCGEDKPDTTWVYYNLNDFTDYRKQETEWLRAEVKSPEFKKAKTHILVHHIPVYGTDDKYNPCLDLWSPILQKTPFKIAINAHTHRFAYHPKGAVGNPFPVVIGGGNNEKSARVMVLEKKNGKLSLKVITAQGESTIYPL